MKLTQKDYDLIVFLNRLVYYDIPYPESFKCIGELKMFNGLRLNIFDMERFQLVVICGTNNFSVRDWVANIKVALGITPRQYQQAYNYICDVAYKNSKPLVICGHSLGGGIAEWCTSELYHRRNVMCITLNGCGCSHLMIPVLRKANVINIITKHDILNGITRRLPFKVYMQHIGESVIIDDEYWFPLSIKSHCDFESFTKYKIEK